MGWFFPVMLDDAIFLGFNLIVISWGFPFAKLPSVSVPSLKLSILLKLLKVGAKPPPFFFIY